MSRLIGNVYRKVLQGSNLHTLNFYVTIFAFQGNMPSLIRFTLESVKTICFENFENNCLQKIRNIPKIVGLTFRS